MAEDPVLRDLRQRQSTILKSRVRPQRAASPEERELRRQRYAQSEASLRSVLAAVKRTVNDRKINLLAAYSKQGLQEESAWYQAISELFYDMATVRKHDLFEFVGGSPQHKKDAMAVHSKALAVAKHYEQLSKKPERFLQSTTADKLHQLLAALENL